MLLSQRKVGTGDPDASQVRVMELSSSTVTDLGLPGEEMEAGAGRRGG